MRTTLAVLAATLLATVADARTTDAGEGRAAGTLTCRTRSDLGLVFGTARIATCTFVAQSGRRQRYAAILPPRATEAGPDLLTWRVVTADGSSRPNLLDGAFSGAPSGMLRGSAAILAPLGSEGEMHLRLAAQDVR